MKKIKWEYEIQVMDDDDFEVIPRGYYDWSDRKNSPAYHGVSGQLIVNKDKAEKTKKKLKSWSGCLLLMMTYSSIDLLL